MEEWRIGHEGRGVRDRELMTGADDSRRDAGGMMWILWIRGRRSPRSSGMRHAPTCLYVIERD